VTRAEPIPDPHLDVCPSDGCDETEDLVVQECSPGRSWMFTGGACGHWGFIYRKPEQQERA
jgi:hypothetical protein